MRSKNFFFVSFDLETQMWVLKAIGAFHSSKPCSPYLLPGKPNFFPSRVWIVLGERHEILGILY